jgi:hypothetical protein
MGGVGLMVTLLLHAAIEAWVAAWVAVACSVMFVLSGAFAISIGRTVVSNAVGEDLGGVVYRNGVWDNEACSGVHIMQGRSEAIVLRPAAVELQRGAPERLTCHEARAERPEEEFALEPLLAEEGCVHGTEDCEDLEACQADLAQLEAFAIRRGSRLVEGPPLGTSTRSRAARAYDPWD